MIGGKSAKKGLDVGVAVGIVLIAIGIVAFASGAEYERSLHDERPVLQAHVYSISFYSAGNSEVLISYNLSRGDMTVLVTNVVGHEEVLESGYPSEENLFLELTATSNHSALWSPDSEGAYYIVFMKFSSENATLSASIKYVGSVPEFTELGIILLLLGASSAAVNLLIKDMRGKKKPGKQSLDEPPRLS